MNHLREVVGDDTRQSSPVSNDIKLDEKSISREELIRRQTEQPANTRIAEKEDGSFVTLHRLNG